MPANLAKKNEGAVAHIDAELAPQIKKWQRKISEIPSVSGTLSHQFYLFAPVKIWL